MKNITKEEWYRGKTSRYDCMATAVALGYDCMATASKFNVGDAVLIKGIVESIYVDSTDNEPVYHVRIKGAGTHEAYGIRVKEDVMKGGATNGD